MEQHKVNIIFATLIVISLVGFLGVAIYVGRSVSSLKDSVERIEAAVEATGDIDLGARGTRFPSGVSVGTTTSPGFGEFVTFGTTTINASFDGYMAGGTFRISTTTAQVLHKNTYGRAFCDGDNSTLYARSNSSFAPSLVFSVGTSTASRPTRNLVASTTIATSSPGVIATYIEKATTTNLFIYNPGDQIIGMIGDPSNAPDASSTYYGNLSAEFQIQCRLTDI